MKKLFALLALCILLASALRTDAQTLVPMTGAGLSGPAASGAYSGPGDIVAGAQWWGGLRAYNSTLANAGATTTPVIDVMGSTTGTGCTIYLKGDGTGDLDFTTAGPGAVGHQCLLGATTFCTSTNVSCTVSKFYDQTTNTIGVSNGTAANQPTLAFNCLGSLPCLTFNGTSSSLTETGFPDTQEPMTVAAVSKNTDTGSQRELYNDGSSHAIGYQNSSTNQFWIFAGAVLAQTASSGVSHSTVGVFNGASSVVYVDNVSNSGSAGTNTGGTMRFVGSGSGVEFLNGSVNEIGEWFSAFSSGQAGNMCHNQFTYWGTATSC